MCLLQLEFIVDVGFILWVKAIVGSILDLISLFNILASMCLARAVQTSYIKSGYATIVLWHCAPSVFIVQAL